MDDRAVFVDISAVFLDDRAICPDISAVFLDINAEAQNAQPSICAIQPLDMKRNSSVRMARDFVRGKH